MRFNLVVRLLAKMLIVALTVICEAARSHAFSDDALRSRFESEAPRAWDQFRRLAQHAQVEFVEKTNASFGNRETYSVCKISGNNVVETLKFIATYDNDKGSAGRSTAFGRNSRYAFALDRGRDVPQGNNLEPWYVKQILESNQPNSVLDAAHRIFLFPYQIWNRLLPEWYQEPGFHVTNVEWADRDGQPLVAVAFHTEKPDKPTPMWIHDGTLYLNPDRHWAIQELAFKATDLRNKEIEFTQRIEFREADKLPMVLRSTISAKTPDSYETTTHEFSTFEHREIPDVEFTLSAFGLPDMPEPESRWTSKRMWGILATIGVMLILLGLLIRNQASPLRTAG